MANFKSYSARFIKEFYVNNNTLSLFRNLRDRQSHLSSQTVKKNVEFLNKFQ